MFEKIFVSYLATSQHNDTEFQKQHQNLKSESEVVAFSAKCWDRRIRADIIEPMTPWHHAQVVEPCGVANLLCLIIVTSKSKDYIAAPQYLQRERWI